MTREHKLALILGFSVVLVVGVLISDHFSDAAVAQLDDLDAEAVPAAETRTAPPIERTHASAPDNDVMPRGFLTDGEGQPTTVAAGNSTVFRSSSEMLLNEIQKSWNATQGAASGVLDQARNAVPAAEIDQPATSPITALLPEPTHAPERATRNKPIASNDVPTKNHRVSEDESLWSIAQEYYGDGALYTKLAEFNKGRVGEDGTIRTGEVLKIPTREALTGERRASKRAQQPKARTASTYTVRDGDTLGEIAQRLLGSSSKWREIAELNEIEDPDVVPTGTTLKLPSAR